MVTLRDAQMRTKKIEHGGQYFTIKKRNIQYTIDNRWVITYCTLL